MRPTPTRSPATPPPDIGNGQRDDRKSKAAAPESAASLDLPHTFFSRFGLNRFVSRLSGLIHLPQLRRRSERSALGRAGEKLAARHLRREGYRLLHRNVILPGGEIDLIMEDPAQRNTIVFVEVKTRRGETWKGEYAISPAKRQRMRRLAILAARRFGWINRRLRIDVVVIVWPAGDNAKPTIRRHRNAITMSD